MDLFILILVGLGMGVMGGLLGIGGSLVMIPALTLIYGENQHLYQAAAMICIFFVSSASMIAHHKAGAISRKILLRMIPAAMVGIVAGVALSNCPLFRGTNDYILARVFGGFLVYVAGYNSFRMYQSVVNKASLKADTTEAINASKTSWPIVAGLLTGIGSGLLGIGAGTIATPLQQLLLKTPIKRAMSNSAVVIVCISWLGAIYKNATLPQHGLEISESLKIAACVIPGAIVGGFIGGHLMHTLPKNIVRAIFIGVCIMAALKLLTVTSG